MEVRELPVPGSWLFVPALHPDERGIFLEGFTQRALEEATGRRLDLAQINVSVSGRGVVRGIHFADLPPGQAKYVQCVVGSVLDVVVDLRVDSPTYGEHAAVMLDDVDRRAVFVSEGLGHGFCVVSEQATVVYATSTPYDPLREHTVHALDPDLALPWPVDVTLLLSPRDANAPSLREARERGLLPH